MNVIGISEQQQSVIVLDNRVDRVESLHRQASQHAGTAVQYAIECGSELVRIKASMHHGEFCRWCEQLTFSYETAKKYMQAAKRAPQIGNAVTDLSLRGLLAATKAAQPTKTKKARPVAKRSKGRKAAAIRAELDEAKQRGASVVFTAGRLLLKALKYQSDFNKEERELLAELADAIQRRSAI